MKLEIKYIKMYIDITVYKGSNLFQCDFHVSAPIVYHTVSCVQRNTSIIFPCHLFIIPFDDVLWSTALKKLDFD